MKSLPRKKAAGHLVALVFGKEQKIWQKWLYFCQKDDTFIGHSVQAPKRLCSKGKGL